jgi:hypothetical protein
MPGPERHARFERLVLLLPDHDISGMYEPGNSIVDSVAQMVDEGVVKYIPWDSCITKDQELLSSRKERSWKPDLAGTMKEVVESVNPLAMVDTDLRLHQALFRRAVACELGMLMTFKAHQQLSAIFMTELQREPPAGFVKLTYSQIHRADVECFRRIAEKTRAGLFPNADGTLPADVALKEILGDCTFRMLLLPTMLAHSASASVPAAPKAPGGGPAGTPSPKKKVKQQQAKAKKAEAKGKLNPDKSDPGGKRVLPKGLSGHSKTPAGLNICFSCSTKGRGCTPGDKCVKGEHCCMECFEKHPLFEHCSA